MRAILFTLALLTVLAVSFAVLGSLLTLALLIARGWLLGC